MPIRLTNPVSPPARASRMRKPLMQTPVKPSNEAQRLADLQALELLDTPAEERFDRITRTAQRLFGVATVLISLVDAERQWFKSACGLDASETPRDISFCGHAILADDAFIIENAAADARFADNPLVTGGPEIRFYAGMPVHGAHNCRVGTLCLIDPAPRRFDGADIAALADLGRLVEAEFHTRQLSQSVTDANANEQRLRAILDNVVDGIITIDARGQVETVNPAAERIFGYAADEIVGNNIKMLMPEPYHAEHDGYLRHYRDTGEARVIGIGREVLGRRKNGEIFPLELAVSEMRLDGARYFSGIVRDISERKAVAKIQARLSAIIASSTDAILSSTLDGIVTSWNPAAEKMFGYARAEMLGHPMALLLPPGHAHEGAHLLERIRHGENVEHFETVRKKKNGDCFPISVTVSPIRDEHGTIIGASKIARDVSERKHAESALLEANVKLAAATGLQQAILNSANASMIATDLDGVIRMFSAGAERMLGYASAELVDQSTPAPLHDPAEVVARAEALSIELGRPVAPGFDAFVAKARGGIPDEAEWTYIRKDGSRLPVMLSVTAVCDAHGALTGFLGIAFDLTERKKIERMKNEFISTVSHELRTPLTSIRGSLGLLVAGAVGAIPARAQALLEIANNNCERLVRLINDILDIEKIESDNMRFDTVVQPLLPLLEQAIASTESFAAQYGVRLVLESGADDVHALIDADRITQVIVNLLSNAAKFSPAGADVTIRLERRPGCLRLSVRDEGPGIGAEFQGRIFAKFAQADASDTRQKGGTGLGLSISRAIIDKHRGRIDFDTVVGAGSTFYFELPDATPVAAGPSRSRVLVCEDDPDIARLLGMILEQGGLSSDIAHDAASARAMLGRGHYEAMTLDLALPGEDGISLLHWMRDDARLASLPVVVVSAKADEGRRALSAGAVGVLDWLTKPIDQARLLQVLQRATLDPAQGTPSVLYVEDDADLMRVVRALLEPGLTLCCAATLAAARERLSEQRFSLIILDLSLPDGNGSELLANLPGLNASTPVMIFSGEEPTTMLLDRVSLALVKSRTPNAQLLATIHDLINRFRTTSMNEENQ
jgi:PAS domain S-box-containing protein